LNTADVKVINDGFYQVIIDDKSYVFRIYTHESDAKTYPCRQIIAIAGGRNSRTFTNFGIIQDGVIIHQFVWWKREEYNDGVVAAAKRLLEGDTDEAGRVYGRKFGRCYVCNRKLTDPNSLATGIGPDCASDRNHVELGGTTTILGDDQEAPLDDMVKPEYRLHVKAIYSTGIERGYYYVEFDEPYPHDKPVKKAFALLRKAVKAYKRRYYHEDSYLEHFRGVRTTGIRWFLPQDLLWDHRDQDQQLQYRC